MKVNFPVSEKGEGPIFRLGQCLKQTLTGGVLLLRSLFSLSVKPFNNVLPPHTITLLYKLWKEMENVANIVSFQADSI